ncbi:MAG TPA: butyrate kinase, partial [Firmicutes bacterium]|nr:butyrate kinase [Bacillota bacterium]
MAEDLRVLAINPGSTSTKIAVFASDQVLLETKVEHRSEELKGFKKATDQYEYRLKVLRQALAEAQFNLKTLAAV